MRQQDKEDFGQIANTSKEAWAENFLAVALVPLIIQLNVGALMDQAQWRH